MLAHNDRFEVLGTDNAPGQEIRRAAGNINGLMRGDKLVERPVDFSHGDVDAFTPTPGAFERFCEAVEAVPSCEFMTVRNLDERIEL